jgi:hypothetical protein
VQYLYAAHIKKRSLCTDDERRDLAHIAMPACLFGCDFLFETGGIAVSDDGEIITASTLPPGSDLAQQLAHLQGRVCSAYTQATAAYFAWHRANQFQT